MSRAKMFTAIFLAAYAVLNVCATTYYVNASRTDDSGLGTSWGTAKKTIQAAINLSAAGDSIIVTNGLYAPINTDNKAVTIQSVSGATNTVIDGGSTTRCATLGSLPAHINTVLNGFTLQEGSAVEYGGGSCYGTLNNCILSGNTAAYGGGSCGGTLNNCTLSGNKAAYYGGGSYLSTLNNCTLSGNKASSGGGSYEDTLNNCIVWGNVATSSGSNCYSSTMRYSCSVPLETGSGNIGANPMFVDAANGNYQLSVGSPCINVGANQYVALPVDLAGNPRISNSTVDMGAYEYTSAIVSFDAQGGMPPDPASKSVGYGSPYGTLATTSRTGYTFAGWWTEAGGTGSEVTSSTIVMITLAQTLYAKWNTDAYTVFNGADAVPIGKTSAVQSSDENYGDGGNSVKLGGVGLLEDGEMAGIEWSVVGSGVLWFAWKVSSEEHWDVLRFYEIGGCFTNQTSGTGSGWSWFEVWVDGNTDARHTYRWEYSKDAIGDYVGEDCGWIDAIFWSPTRELVVYNGTGGGMYGEGAVVTITAETPPANFKFDRWTGYTNGLADVFSASTTLLMPANAVVLTATYIPSELQQLDVINGRGSGMYYENSQVRIIADPDPMYMEFAGWTGGDAFLLADDHAPSTSFIMPTHPVSLTATYRDSIARVSGSYGHVYAEFGAEGGISTDPNAESPSGTAAVKLGGAGVLPNNNFAAFETTVFGSGSATFWWRTSSEVNDYLRFLVDGVERASISGTKIPWTWVSNRVENAEACHTLRWEYAKDGSYASTADAGWVDDIVWIGDVPMPAITPDICTTANAGTQFKFSFWGERGIPYTVYSNATVGATGWGPMDIEPQEVGETNGVFRYEATISPPAGKNSGFYRIKGGEKP